MKKHILLLFIPIMVLCKAGENKFSLSDPTKTQGDTKGALKVDSESTAYCAIGTRKGLMEQGIIINKQHRATLLKTGSAAVDKYKTTEITISSRWVKILSIHPTGSYTLIKMHNKIKKLVITNPDKFWSVSNCLVIEVANVY